MFLPEKLVYNQFFRQKHINAKGKMDNRLCCGECEFDAVRPLSGLDEVCYTISEAGEMSENASTIVWGTRHLKDSLDRASEFLVRIVFFGV